VFGADSLVNGRISYGYYCASCHGLDGQGGGPVASALASPPSNLTRITTRYGGTFPSDLVYAYIDGRQYVRAHGTRDMPVWGHVWAEAEGQRVPRAVVDQRITEVVKYIESMQAADSVAAP
jgi:mono/diheme cytochrome c family protein